MRFKRSSAASNLHTSDQARMPYGVSIDHVSQTTYVVLWAEGDAPNTQQLRGRFVTLN